MSRKPKTTKSQPYSKLTAATPPSTTSPVPQMTAQQAYQVAEQRFKTSQFREAEIICRQVLEVDSRHANALHLLGVMAAQAGFYNEAERLISQAIAINPTVQNYHDSLANVHKLQNQAVTTKSSDEKTTDPTSYAHWIKLYDTLSDNLQKKIQQHLKHWQSPPKISVLLATYNSNDTWLQTAIESVQNQLYPYWELCIADDASTLPSVRHLLEEVVKQETRIKVTSHLANQGISAISNQALALAKGDYVVLLDHHDLLAPHALFLVAKEIITHPETILIYSDEDQINDQGERVEPYFKPTWNPDLFRSQNFLQRLVAYKTALLRKIGGFREGYEVAYEYDASLRLIEQINDSQIRHLPHVLYHRRVNDSQTTTTLGFSQVALAQKIVAEHLARTGVNAQVKEAFNCPGALRVQYALPAGEKITPGQFNHSHLQSI